MMLCSLNEVEMQVRKAARGAGFSWGLAEEAGWAARFLEAHRLPCLAALIALLDWRQGRPHAVVAPDVEGAVWRARGGCLCAITTGSAWHDFATDSRLSEPVEFRTIAAPALLAPFIAATARRLARPLALRGGPVTMSFDVDRMWLSGRRAALSCPVAEALTVHALETVPNTSACSAVSGGVDVDDRTWSQLGHYAVRTYVPTTVDSRLYGAGAGLLDND
jgi:hypothetical protein